MSFYIYPEAAYDQWAVLECWPAWPYEDQAAEVSMLMLLIDHPRRVYNPENASLFVVPVLPYTSYLAGDCMGDSHEGRMNRASVALARSPWFAQSQGHDHVLVCNTFRVGAALRAFKARAPAQR